MSLRITVQLCEEPSARARCHRKSALCRKKDVVETIRPVSSTRDLLLVYLEKDK